MNYGKKQSSGIAKFDTLLALTTIILLAFGLLMVYNASSVSAFRDFRNQYYYLQEQAKWLILGFLGMMVTSNLNYKIYQRFAPILMGISTLLLIGVFLPGIGIKAYGAHRWINLGFTVIQPAELIKLALVIYLSAWFSHEKTREGSKKFLPLLVLCGILIALIMIQPDMGTAMVIVATSITMYFLSGAPLSHFIGIIPPFILGSVILVIKSPYRLRRLTTFLDPTADPQGASYHIRQVLISLGSGGLFGMGVGKSRQKYEYLPEATTDSIFAVIAEELGFIGSLAFLGLFIFIIYRGFKIAKEAPDRFSQLLALGISSWLGIQICINLAAMVALIPLTGVPLPFISYGGSSLVIALVGIGILLNISKYSIKRKL